MRPQDKQQQTEAGRKTYKQPRLEVYGDLRDITRAIGFSGKKDNAKTPPFNTKS